MKDQLQLQEIAGYLRYGLKVMSEYGEISEIDSIHWSLDGHLRTKLNLCIQQSPSRFRGANLEHVKPILRPMSDLRTEDFNELCTSLGLYTGADINFVIGSPKQLQYNDAIKLLENHFDIHNLIGRGLAISIHDIPTK